MKKIDFQNNVTKVNKATFDEFQNNIEEASIIVSPTEPTTNEKVWIQKGKNLFNSSFEQGSFNFNNGENSTNDEAIIRLKGLMKVEPNTVYTISCNENIGEFGCTFYDINQKAISGVGNGAVEEKYYTLTTPENAHYIRIRIGNDTYPKTYTTDYEVQLEQGSTVTEYEEYVDKKINVENSEFLNVEKMGIETITNENGTAIKFPNGTMICYGGWHVLKDTSLAQHNFPISFIAMPTITTSTNIEAGISFTPNVYVHAEPQKDYFTIRLNRNAGGTGIIGGYVAIGRWK